MPVKRKEEFECVEVENFDGRVEEGDGEELAVGRVTDAEDVVGHFEGAGVEEGGAFC